MGWSDLLHDATPPPWLVRGEHAGVRGVAWRSGLSGRAFYRMCADAAIPELTTLAETIETWWPALEVFMPTGLANARVKNGVGYAETLSGCIRALATTTES